MNIDTLYSITVSTLTLTLPQGHEDSTLTIFLLVKTYQFIINLITSAPKHYCFKKVFIQVTQGSNVMTRKSDSPEDTLFGTFMCFARAITILWQFLGKWCTLLGKSTNFGVRLSELGSASYKQGDLAQVM